MGEAKTWWNFDALSYVYRGKGDKEDEVQREREREMGAQEGVMCHEEEKGASAFDKNTPPFLSLFFVPSLLNN